MSIIALKNIKKHYTLSKEVVVKAVDGVDLEIQPGELLAIKGASGSGKSTLLYLLGCVEKATEGEYLFDNKPVSSLSESKRALIRNKKIGFVLQDFGLIEEESVLQNIKIPLLISGGLLSAKEKQIDPLLRQFGILELKKKKVSRLSGGQRQRVALVRALINDPDVILADEPTGALDSEMSQEIMNAFLQLNELGKTVIIVTHDDSIASCCKRVVYMKDGKLMDSANPA